MTRDMKSWMIEIACCLALTGLLFVLSGCKPSPQPTPMPEAAAVNDHWKAVIATEAADITMTHAPAPQPPVPDDAGSLPGVPLPATAATDTQSIDPTDAATGTAASGGREADQKPSGCDGGNCSGGSCGIRLRARLFRRGQ